MKKKLALILALVIALASVFMAACGDDDDDDSSKKKSKKDKEETSDSADYELEDIIEGKWESNFDFEKYMKANVDEDEQEMFDYIDFSKVEMCYTFEFDDGEIERTLDSDKVKTSFAKVLIAGMKKYAAKNYDTETYEQMLDQIDEYAEGYAEEMVAQFEDLEWSGYYMVDDNKIYIAADEDDLEDSDEYLDCKVQGKKKIKVTEWAGSSDFEEFLPFTMTKK